MVSPFSSGPLSGHPPPPPPQWNGDPMMYHHPAMAGYHPGPPPNVYYPQVPPPPPPAYTGHAAVMTPSHSLDGNLAPPAELNGIGLPPSKSDIYYDEFGHSHPIHPPSQPEDDHMMEPPAKRQKAEPSPANGDEDEDDDEELKDAPPLPPAMRLSTKPSRPKPSASSQSARAKLLGLFRDDSEVDVRAHLGVKSKEALSIDIDTVIDEHGHTALHWAASLAKISVVEQLIELGADIHRGNFNGETALARAMLTTNNAEASTLSQLLAPLAPSIRTLDQSYRSVVHHIALVSGLTGRAAAARTYLTGVLEWVAKEQQLSASLGQGHPPASAQTNGTSPSLSLKTLVDVQDLYGDTVLNVSARMGNRGLVKLLLDAGADKSKANKLGLKPVDFGVEVEVSCDFYFICRVGDQD